MKQHFIYSGVILGMAISLMVTITHFSQRPDVYPAPIKRIFEAQDGVHVLYKGDDRIEDILIELEDEQDVYSFDIDGSVHGIQIIRHCTIGDCDVVDVCVDNDRLVCVPSHVRRANQN